MRSESSPWLSTSELSLSLVVEVRLVPGVVAQLSLDSPDVPQLRGVAPRIRIEPGGDAVPRFPWTVAGIAPVAAGVSWVVVGEADGRCFIIGAERGRLPAQRLGAGTGGAIRDPLDLTQAHRLVHLVGAGEPGLRRIELIPSRPHVGEISECLLVPDRLLRVLGS